MTRPKTPRSQATPEAESLGTVDAAVVLSRALQALARAHPGQSHREQRRDELLLRTLFEWLADALERATSVHLHVTEEALLLENAPVPMDSALDEVRSTLFASGLREIRFFPGLAEKEVLRFLNFLVSLRGSAETAENLSPQSRVLAARFAGISLRADLLANDWDHPCHSTPVDLDWDWSHEILLEEYRNLQLETGLAIIEDLRRQDTVSSYRRAASRLLSRLFSRLMKEGQVHAALRLLEGIDDDESLSSEDLSLVSDVLEEFRDESFLRPFLHSLPTAKDPAIASFLLRLGDGVVPMLLQEVRRTKSESIHLLLEAMVAQNPEPFTAALEAASLETRELALNYLLSAGDKIPSDCLQRLSNSDSTWLRAKALRVLIEHHPECVPARSVLDLLDDASAAVRQEGLRWLERTRDPQYFGAVLQWFRRKNKSLSFSERKQAFVTIAYLGGAAALGFLHEWIDLPDPVELEDFDRDNRLCAIFALGSLDLPEARSTLETLSQSQDGEIQKAAREALR